MLGPRTPVGMASPAQFAHIMAWHPKTAQYLSLMKFLIIKYAVTAFIIVVVSEVAKRTDRLGALLASLPLVTIMVMIWLYVEGQGDQKIGSHAFYTFWYVIPTLPMFLAMPELLKQGYSFWLSLGICVLITILCFVITAFIGSKFGVSLLP